MDVSYVTDLITKERAFGFLIVELQDPYVSAVVIPEFFMAAFTNVDHIATLTEYQQQYVATHLFQYYLRNKVATTRGQGSRLVKLKSWPASMHANSTLEPILPLLVKPRMFMMAASTIAKTGVKWYHGEGGQTYIRCMRRLIALDKIQPKANITGKLLTYVFQLELEGCDTSYITEDIAKFIGF